MPEDSVSSRCWTINLNNRTQDIGYTLCIYAAFITLGWVQTLSGSGITLQDFMVISSSENSEDGQWFLWSFLIGCGLGALTGGIFYDKVNRDLVFGPCLLVLACTMAVAPWCSLYWAAISVHVIQGIAMMVVIIGGNAEILSMWRDNRITFLVLYLLHRLGRFTSPLIVKPYMNDHHDIYSNRIVSSTPDYSGLSSRLYIPYSIMALFIAVIAVVLFLLSCVCKKSVLVGNATNYTRSQNQPRELPMKVKVIAVIIMSACLTLCTTGTERSMKLLIELTIYPDFLGHHLSLYIVILVYAVYGLFLTSTVVTMFLTCHYNTMVIAGIHCFLIFLSLSAFVISFLLNSVVGVCISLVAIEGFQVVLFSLLLVWTNEYITPVTGKISSLIVMTSLIGYVLGSVLMVYLLYVDTMCFHYLILIERVLLLLLCTIAFIMTRHIMRRYGKTYSNTIRTYDDEVVSERLVMSEH